MENKNFNLIVNKQNNSINGSFIWDNKKYFFKLVNIQDYCDELNGYLESQNSLPVKEIIYNDYFSDSKYIIIYEYENTIGINKGLLNDLLVKYDIKKNITNAAISRINKILSVYNKNLKKIKVLNSSLNDRFFIDRISSRLKEWYQNDKNFSKYIFINGSKCKSINKIIDEVTNYFLEKKMQVCFFSQGDPNTLNIALKPCFFDLVTAGYNSVIGEFAIMLVSTLIYDNYFCPKYHSESYFLHEKALKQYILFEPFIEVNDRKYSCIEINCTFKSSNIRKEYVFRYIEMLKKNNIFINSDIKYYIVMRLLSVFNVEKMETKDYFYSIYLVEYFYYLFKDENNDIFPLVEKMLLDMESI